MGQRKRRFFTGGSHQGFGVLGPRREAHNKIVKALANLQRRRHDQAAIQVSLSD
jgi:hypothetical protein